MKQLRVLLSLRSPRLKTDFIIALSLINRNSTVHFSLPFFSLEEKKQKNKFANEVGTNGLLCCLRQGVFRSGYRQAPVPDCVLVLHLMCFSSSFNFPVSPINTRLLKTPKRGLCLRPTHPGLTGSTAFAN